MPSFSEIREALRSEAAHWRARMEAFEVQLALGRAEAADRLEAAKGAMAEALRRFEADLKRTQELAGKTAEQIKARIDALQVQLALGRAETLDALRQQQERIQAALTQLERQADEAGATAGAGWQEACRRLAEAVLRVEVEYDALELRMQMEQRKGAAALQAAQRALAKRASEMRTLIQVMERESGERLAAFRKDMTAAWDDLGRAFRDLLG